MTRRTPFAAMAALTVALLLAAGCGGDDDDGGGDTAATSSTTEAESTTSETTETTESTTTETTAGSDGDGVPVEEYATGVCTAMSTWQTDVQGLATDLQADPPTDPATGKQVLIDFVAEMSAVTTTMVDEVDAAGPPDVDSGEDIHGTLVDGLTALSDLFDQLEVDMAAVPDNDPAAFSEALTQVTTQFQASAQKIGEAFGTIDQTYPEQSAEIQAAFQAEPACAGVIG